MSADVGVPNRSRHKSHLRLVMAFSQARKECGLANLGAARLVMLRLLVIIRQEGSALRVSGLRLLLAEGELTAFRYSGTDDERQAEQRGHNDEGKDPLESNDLALELTNSQGRRQEAEPEAKDVVLIGCQFANSAGLVSCRKYSHGRLQGRTGRRPGKTRRRCWQKSWQPGCPHAEP